MCGRKKRFSVQSPPIEAAAHYEYAPAWRRERDAMLRTIGAIAGKKS